MDTILDLSHVDFIETTSISIGMFKEIKSFPKKCNTIYIYDNIASKIKITIPKLPEGLKSLIIKNTSVQYIPKLPSSLEELNILHCEVKNLPELPEGLKFLDVSGNHLKKLPTLPQTLISLKCKGNNNLNVLPLLPSSLKTLDCDTRTIINSNREQYKTINELTRIKELDIGSLLYYAGKKYI